MSDVGPASKKVPTPEDYPRQCHPESPSVPRGRPMGARSVLAKKLSFEWMREVTLFAEHNVRTKFWKKKVMTGYLRTCAISENVQNYIWSKHNPKKRRRVCEIDAETVAVENACVIDANTDYSDKLWESPIDINAFLEAVMHHLFHGCVADIYKLADDFMKDHNFGAGFEKKVNPYLIEIQSLRLEWFKTKKVPKAQWLAEDELGYARLLPFVYSLSFMDLKKPVNSDTSDECFIALEQIIQSLHVLLCSIMSPRNPNPDLIDCYVKTFLSCCDRYWQCRYEKETKPFWANTGNFPSLLNIKDMIKMFGPPREYWEGTKERFIGSVKKVLKSMRKSTSYFERKLVVIQKLNLMEWKKNTLRNPKNARRKDDSKMYHRYDSLELVQQILQKGQVISGFQLQNREDWIFIAYGPRGRNMNVIPLIPIEEQSGVLQSGLVYRKYQLDVTKKVDMQRKELWEERMEHYCLLLPYVRQEILFGQQYAVVFHDWDVMNAEWKKALPRICNTLFEHDVISNNG